MEDRDPQCHEWARYTEVGVAVELCQEEGNHNSALVNSCPTNILHKNLKRRQNNALPYDFS